MEYIGPLGHQEGGLCWGHNSRWAPKTSPRRPQDAPKRPKDGPRSPRGRARTHPRRPKTPRAPPEAAKTRPELPKMPSRSNNNSAKVLEKFKKNRFKHAKQGWLISPSRPVLENSKLYLGIVAVFRQGEGWGGARDVDLDSDSKSDSSTASTTR